MAFDFFGMAALRDASDKRGPSAKPDGLAPQNHCKIRPVFGYSDGAMSDGLVSTTIQLATIWLKQA
jgi:hypothetical protein